MAGHHLGYAFQLLLGVEHAGGVRGAAEHDELGARRDGGLKLLGGHLEVILELGLHEDTLALGQTDKLLVAHPERRGDDNLVARVDQALHHLEKALLGTRRDDNLLGLVLQPVVTAELLADGLAQVRVARHRRIVGEVVVDSLLGCLFHHLGSVEVRLAYRKADDIFALGFELAGLGGHGESLALGHIHDSVGEYFHVCKYFESAKVHKKNNMAE